MKQEPLSLSLVKLIFVAMIITSIGIALLISATGYFLSKPKIEPVVSGPVIVPPPTPTIEDETAELVPSEVEGWKTYRNEEYGFKIKYPGDYELLSRGEFTEINPPLNANYESSYCRIVIGYKDSSFKISSFLEWHNKNMPGNELKSINEESESFIKATEMDGVQSTTNYCYFSDGQKTIYVTCNKDKNNTIYNQMLSTFRFIETEDETADWKTYRNGKYGYEVEYPARIKQEEIWYKENEEPSFEKCHLYMFDECYTSLSVVEFRYIWEEPPFQKDSYPRCYSRFIIKVIENPSFPSLEKLKETFKKSEYITIDDKKGLRRNEFIGLPPGGGGYEDVVYLPRNSRLYLISYIIDRETVGEENIEKCLNEQSNIYNQILSTFKFIEKDETADWKTYRFELEDITKPEDFEIDPKTNRWLKYPFNTRVWKIDLKTSKREIFIKDTRENVGIAFDNLGFPGISYSSKEILKIGDKLYLRPYNPGMAPGPSDIWQLDLNTKIFKKLFISKILGGFASKIWSPDKKKIIVIPPSDKGDAKDMYLVDLIKDEYRLLFKLKDNETFSPNKDDIGIGTKPPDIKWIDNSKIKYAVYDQSKKSFEGYDSDKEEAVEKILIGYREFIIK